MVIFKNRILLIFSALSAFLILISAALVLFSVNNLNAPLILHFDAYQGVDRLGEVSDLWLVIAGGIVVFFINVFLSSVLFYRLRAVAYLLASVNLLVSILLLAAVAVIISVN